MTTPDRAPDAGMRYEEEMRRPAFVPSPVALLSAALSFGLLIGTAVLAQTLAPGLVDLLRTSPRLAMLGFCGIVLAPALVVTLVHHVGHRAMDSVDSKRPLRSILPSAESWWAGAHAWLVLGGASVLSRMAMLVIEPPKLEPESFITTLTREASEVGATANLTSLYPVLWIVIAAQLFELERRSRRSKKDA